MERGGRKITDGYQIWIMCCTGLRRQAPSGRMMDGIFTFSYICWNKRTNERKIMEVVTMMCNHLSNLAI
jgi:hypothetical protein